MSKNHQFVFIAVFCVIQILKVSGFEIRDDWYYIDGDKYFIKGLGYEPHTRPGQTPWEYQFNAATIQTDMQHINAAGFNTIRTWDALSEEELQVVNSSGLKILMGIWIDPHGAYGDPVFISDALNYVNRILDYSRDFECILAYIIMNEPQVADILSGGADALVDLWQNIISLVQDRHPGVPVTFSNTAVGDYIRSDLFQICAYNLYIYNPVLISNTHGYTEFCHIIKENRAVNKPFIITEFGLSVSPGTPGDTYGYGGNTLEQQTTGNLLMYRGLIDGGAQGGCVFQYHDGWWKAGNPDSHDPNPEEWFGLNEFDSYPTSISGTARPVWQAFSKYNQAIVYQPQNGGIYPEKIPVELFLTEAVDNFTVSIDDSIIFTQKTPTQYFQAEIPLSHSCDVVDLQPVFRFYDNQDTLLKLETISILSAPGQITLPTLAIRSIPEDVNQAGTLHLIAELLMDSIFSIENNQLDYGYFPHLGFHPGEARQTEIQLQYNHWQFTDNFSITNETMVVTLGAGLTMHFGAFRKRISAQKILSRGDWAASIAAENTLALAGAAGPSKTNFYILPNYPNPFNVTTTIRFFTQQTSPVTIAVFNIIGKQTACWLYQPVSAGWQSYHWNAEHMATGPYMLRIQSGAAIGFQKLLIIK